MKRLSEEVIFQSSYYFNYQKYMLEVANPVCEGCDVLTDLSSRCAVAVLGSVAITNFRKTRIKGVDKGQERAALMQGQADMLRQVGECPGPKVIDNDMELAKERILSFPGFTDEFREAALKRVIPVAEVCGMVVRTELSE